MSWSLSYEYEGGDISEATNESVDKFVTRVEGRDEPVEVAEQVMYAIAYADGIIGSGSVGDPNGKYRVYIGGHANPEHKPTSGWANDCLNIQISQIGE